MTRAGDAEKLVVVHLGHLQFGHLHIIVVLQHLIPLIVHIQLVLHPLLPVIDLREHSVFLAVHVEVVLGDRVQLCLGLLGLHRLLQLPLEQLRPGQGRLLPGSGPRNPGLVNGWFIASEALYCLSVTSLPENHVSGPRLPAKQSWPQRSNFGFSDLLSLGSLGSLYILVFKLFNFCSKSLLNIQLCLKQVKCMIYKIQFSTTT